MLKLFTGFIPHTERLLQQYRRKKKKKKTTKKQKKAKQKTHKKNPQHGKFGHWLTKSPLNPVSSLSKILILGERPATTVASRGVLGKE